MTIPIVILLYAVVLFLAALEARILWQIATRRIDVHLLINNGEGNVSLSRFQFLIFRFVVAASFFYLTLKDAAFPPVNDGVLVLLGISCVRYAVGKTLDKVGAGRPARTNPAAAAES
ncbi:MAG: hypothetical protein ABI488_01260 [Polyangiaceae bacterium]